MVCVRPFLQDWVSVSPDEHVALKMRKSVSSVLAEEEDRGARAAAAAAATAPLPAVGAAEAAVLSTANVSVPRSESAATPSGPKGDAVAASGSGAAAPAQPPAPPASPSAADATTAAAPAPRSSQEIRRSLEARRQSLNANRRRSLDERRRQSLEQQQAAAAAAASAGGPTPAGQQALPVASAPLVARAVSGKSRKKHVLAVDDDRTNQLLIRRILAKYGFDVTVAVDGLDAVEAFKKGKFDLILMVRRCFLALPLVCSLCSVLS